MAGALCNQLETDVMCGMPVVLSSFILYWSFMLPMVFSHVCMDRVPGALWLGWLCAYITTSKAVDLLPLTEARSLAVVWERKCLNTPWYSMQGTLCSVMDLVCVPSTVA